MHCHARCCFALALKLIKKGSGREVLENGQIDQICAINCGILQNGSNKPTTKCKNLVGVKSILKSVGRLASYRIGALTLIGRLCTDMGQLIITH